MLLKNLSILVAAIGLSACAGVGGSGVAFEKTGEVAGTAGLDVAAKKCAALEGTRDWQTCVAHYDGLYTKNNGVIKRSYALSADAPKPTGKVEKCNIKATWNGQTESWTYSSCEVSK